MRAVAGLTDDLKLGIGFWIWRSLYGSWDKAANREGANPSLTCATVKANGAARKPMNGINAPQRPDCVAGATGLEPLNGVANYPFEMSHEFLGVSAKLRHQR